MSAATSTTAWLTGVLDSLLRPRRVPDSRRLLLLTATPAAICFGVLLLRHVTYSVFSVSASTAFTDMTA